MEFEITPSFLRALNEPWQPNKKSVDEFNDMMEQEYNVRYEGQEANEATCNFMNFYRVLLKIEIRIQIKERLVKTLHQIKLKKELN